MKSVEMNHDYPDLMSGLGPNDGSVPDLKNAVLNKTKETFLQGLDRVACLCKLPSHSVLFARFEQYTYDMAAVKETGKFPDDEQLKTHEYPFPIHLEQEKIASRLWHDHIGFDKGAAAEMVAAKFCVVVGGLHHELISRGLESLITTIPLMALTVFEVLALDLWIDALNANSDLAKKYATAGAGGGDNKKEGKMIAINSLGKYGDKDFNLKGKMGDVLYGEEKASFLTLQSTEQNYSRAFGKEFSLFNEPALKLLDLVRNLIAHKNGRVDQKFLDELKDKNLDSYIAELQEKGTLGDPKTVNLEVNKPFPLTGKLAFLFLDTADSCGWSLLKTVDALLF